MYLVGLQIYHTVGILRITVDGVNRCGNASEQRLVRDLVNTVVVYKSWLIKVTLQLPVSFKRLNLLLSTSGNITLCAQGHRGTASVAGGRLVYPCDTQYR